MVEEFYLHSPITNEIIPPIYWFGPRKNVN